MHGRMLTCASFGRPEAEVRLTQELKRLWAPLDNEMCIGYIWGANLWGASSPKGGVALNSAGSGLRRLPLDAKLRLCGVKWCRLH